MANLLDDEWRESVKKILLDKEIKIWVVDNIASLTPGIDENSKQEWDPINKWLLDLRFAGISTILLHHTNKNGGQRGTSAREDNIDNSIMLRQPPEYKIEDGCKFIMEFKKNRVESGDHFLIAEVELNYRGGMWTVGNLGQTNKRRILELLNDGISQRDICDILKVSKGYVSQVRAKAIKEGLLTKKNKLTDIGFSEIQN